MALRPKNILTTAIAGIVTAAILGGCTGMALAANQDEGTIPQSGDLCGGTGGKGQIVGVGNSDFTLKRYDNGSDQTIHLTGQATIDTSAGPITLSGLKIGDNVTLVGSPDPDGSFTANTVLVCAAAATATAGPSTSLGTENSSVEYEHVSGIINTVMLLCVSLIWFGSALYLYIKKRKGLVYLLFFTIFYIYFCEVLNVTLIEFQSLLLLRYFVPDLMLRGVSAGRSLNLIPLVTLRLADVHTSLLNVLMMMPFGFGLPFITDFRFKKTVIAGMLVSIAIEFLQFVTGFLSNTTFRIADINDVIFNTLGVAIGFILFVQFIQVYRRMIRSWNMRSNSVLQYIAKRPQV